MHATTTTSRTPEEVIADARSALRPRRFRVDVVDGALSAEKGYLRETGNLVFHLSLVLLLVAVALGHLFGYKANVLVVEGSAFSNTVSAYDTWTPGPLADETALAPFTVELDDLEVRYQESGQQRGAPRDFRAAVRYTASPDAEEKSYVLRVNHPLKVDGVKVFLLGNGYAPVFTVRDKAGEVVSRGPVPFLPRDGNNTSTGVVKVPGTSPQLGFEGVFLPDGGARPAGRPDLGLPRPAAAAGGADGVHRRPRRRRRDAAVGVLPRQARHDPGDRRERPEPGAVAGARVDDDAAVGGVARPSTGSGAGRRCRCRATPVSRRRWARPSWRWPG